MLVLEIPGNIRSKKNSKQIFARPGRRAIVIPSKAYKKWEEEARILAMSQRVGQFIGSQKHGYPITFNLQVSAVINFTGPEPDLLSWEESIADAFQGIIWENDRQIQSWDGSRKFRTKNDPRTVVIVKRFEEIL